MAETCNFDCLHCKYSYCGLGRMDANTIIADEARFERVRVSQSTWNRQLREEKNRRYCNACMPIVIRRKEMGLSQKELAKLVGCSATCICYWERGIEFPDLYRLEKVMPGITAQVEPLLEAARKEEKL